MCCLHLQQHALELVDLNRYAAVDDILGWVERQAADASTVVVGVDAPTLIPNETGMRLPDRLAHKHFGKYDAGCYPANRSRPFAQKLIAFGLALESRGFLPCPRGPGPIGGALSAGNFSPSGDGVPV